MIRVLVRKRRDPAVWAEAAFTLTPAAEPRMSSRLREARQSLCLPDGTPHVSHVPAEAACYSGALYGMRLIEEPVRGTGAGYEFTLLRVAGVLAPEDFDGFACACAAGVCLATGCSWALPAEPGEDWTVDETECDLTTMEAFARHRAIPAK